MTEYYKTKDQTTGFKNRIKNRKIEILTAIRELESEYRILESVANLADILDEYENEFENEESEDSND